MKSPSVVSTDHYAADIETSAYDPIDYLGLNAALYEWAESYDSKVRGHQRFSFLSASESCVGLESPGSLHCSDHANRLSLIP